MARQDTVGKKATTVRRSPEGAITVRYHSTDVVTVSPNGRIVLDHGGWTTFTTKTRMNQASNQFRLGFSVFQKDFAWYVDVDGHTLEFDRTPLVIRNGRDY